LYPLRALRTLLSLNSGFTLDALLTLNTLNAFVALIAFFAARALWTLDASGVDPVVDL
jgi:hypothetical protein